MLVLDVCCTRCKLMIMTWRDRERCIHFVFGKDGRVVHQRVRDGNGDAINIEDTSGYEKSGVHLA